MSKISVPGKFILFGEHSVLYGAPALTIPFAKGISGFHYPNSENNIIVTVNGSNQLHKEFRKCINKISQLIPCRPFVLNLNSDIPFGAGLGTSAAFSVILAKTAGIYSLNPILDSKIHETAHEFEKIFHGNPSGIDDSTVFYEKPILFTQPDFNFSKFPLSLKNITSNISLVELPPLHFAVGFSGVTSSTSTMIESLGTFLNESNYRSEFTAKMTQFFNAGIFALGEKNLELLGHIMNMIQTEYKSIGISCKELDDLVMIANNNGALGTKLSGSGGGGVVIALVNSLEDKIQVETAWGKSGFIHL